MAYVVHMFIVLVKQFEKKTELQVTSPLVKIVFFHFLLLLKFTFFMKCAFVSVFVFFPLFQTYLIVVKYEICKFRLIFAFSRLSFQTNICISVITGIFSEQNGYGSEILLKFVEFEKLYT